MTALSVQVPFPVFTDADGQPLDNGSVYIGTANTDAVTNPISVYWDEALTIPAAQPIKTTGGYLYYQGTPTNVYVNADDFSITVQDSKGNLVYSAPEVIGAAGLRADLAASSGSSLVGYIQSGTGAAAQTVQSALRRTITPQDFGAAGDGSTDDTTAFQNAVNEAQTKNLTLYLPGAFKIGAITITGNLHLLGAGSQTTITAKSGNYDMFTISGSDVTIENLYIDDTAKTGGWDFTLACGTSTLERLNFTNINSFYSFGFMRDTGTTGVHVTTRVTECQARGHRGYGIYFTRPFAFIFLTQISIDYVGMGAAANWTGFYFNPAGIGGGAGGLVMDDCDVLGTMGVFYNANQRGYDIRNTAAVWMKQCRADTVGEIGFVFEDITGLHLVGTTAGLCGSHGYFLTDVINSSFVGIEGFGRNYLSGAPAGADGIRIVSGCGDIVMTGGYMRDFTGNGIYKIAAQAGPINIGTIQLIANTLRGVASAGDSPVLLTGVQFRANGTGNYDLAGTSDYLQVSQLDATTVVSVGPGPVTG